MKMDWIILVVADFYGDLFDMVLAVQFGWWVYLLGFLLIGIVVLVVVYLFEYYGVLIMLMGLLIGFVFNFVNVDV